MGVRRKIPLNEIAARATTPKINNSDSPKTKQRVTSADEALFQRLFKKAKKPFRPLSIFQYFSTNLIFPNLK